MDLNEAKSELIDGYVAAGYQLIEDNEEIIFSHRRVPELVLLKDDIAEYAKTAADRESLQAMPVECSICGPNYREQIVRELSPRIAPNIRLRRNDPVVLGKQGDGVYAEIGAATDLFINFFRFDEAYLELSNARGMRSWQVREAKSPIDIRDVAYRPTTIRVYDLSTTTVSDALRKSTEYIHTCFWNLAYLTSMALGLVEEWPIRSRLIRDRPFEFHERVRLDSDFNIPKVSYNSDTVNFYLLGASTDIPILQYLAFYQVLEYHFVAVSDEQLYAKLGRHIKDPRFRPTPQQLDTLIREVTEHQQQTDETRMLRNVLEKYADERELIQFIKEYEEYLEDNRFTKRRNLFGESVQINLQAGHVMGNVAKRIKVVRNALVHSSDRYSRNVRYIPFSESTEIVMCEIPLVKYLAEKIIIATAE